VTAVGAMTGAGSSNTQATLIRLRFGAAAGRPTSIWSSGRKTDFNLEQRHD
jgi:hypothetical protein